MSYFVQPNLTKINLAPESEIEDILQNVAVILATRRGTAPLARDIGLSQDCLDRPMPVAQALLTVEINEAVEAQEPRVEVLGVKFEIDPVNLGRLVPIVEVQIKDE